MAHSSYNEQHSTVRSSSLKADGTVATEYNRAGLALAIFAALCFFCGLWGVNGYFTARTVRGVGLLFGVISLSWSAGWLVHVVVSLIEHHLWKLRKAVKSAPLVVHIAVYCLIVLVGVLDVFTSTLAFLTLFATFGFSVIDPTVRTVAVVLAEIIAIIPEPVIVWLSIALWRVMRSEA